MMRMDSPLEQGSKFGRLTVSSGPKRIDGYIRFECVCECGSNMLVKGTSLRSGNTKSCGCLRKDNDRARRESMPEWSICGIAGCENKARTRKGHRCEKHYYRMRRTGEYSDPAYGYRTITSHGYVSVTAHNHPMTMKSGCCYEHRMVLYDAVKGENQECHWCRREIFWFGDGEKIVVDHLDNNKENNDESNLVASCHKCNSVRGLFMKWVHDHIDDPFLTKLFNQSNSGPDGFPLKPRKG